MSVQLAGFKGSYFDATDKPGERVDIYSDGTISSNIGLEKDGSRSAKRIEYCCLSWQLYSV